MRQIPATRPQFLADDSAAIWPAKWIAGPPSDGAVVMAYRRRFSLTEATRVRIHVTADQRYRLFVNGERQGEGPERGAESCWYYETYDIELGTGTHCITALVWSMERSPGLIPGAQISLRHGFLLAADAPHTDVLSTGIARWKSKQVRGIRFALSGLGGAGLDSGPVCEINGEHFPWGIENESSDEGWESVEPFAPGQARFSRENWGLRPSPLLVPGTLPPMTGPFRPFENLRYAGDSPRPREPLRVSADTRCRSDEERIRASWTADEPWTVAPGRRLWLVVDLDDYHCGYPEVTIARGRGAAISLLWAESLFHELTRDGIKGDRDAIEEKVFFGRGDTFRVGPCRAEELYAPLWWSCGRYIAILIETADEALVVTRAGFRESRYPWRFERPFRLANDAFSRGQPLMRRSLEMCSHETFMDCPYYEQLNYAGDTRIQALTTYVLTLDDRLPRKCIELFRQSLLPSGLTQARFPSNVIQVIPQFSLHWIDMVHDLALWRGHREEVARLLPVCRLILDTFREHIGKDGLVRCPAGWDWVDWAWRGVLSKGAHPVGPEGASAVNHLQLIYTLGHAAELEQWAGRAPVAEDYKRLRKALWQRAVEVFWNAGQGLFAATSRHDCYSDHAQCFAVLSGMMDSGMRESIKRALDGPTERVRASYYFQFYYFATLAELGLTERIVEDFGEWGQMADLGLRTTLERADPSRSDCHAWSAHPLYHAAVSIGGIRPVGLGFAGVRIRPALGAVPSAEIHVPHPLGEIGVCWESRGDAVEVCLSIPQGLRASVKLPGVDETLRRGESRFRISATTLPGRGIKVENTI